MRLKPPDKTRTVANNATLGHFRARYFDAELGRFVGRDPIGYVDGLSLYRGYFVPNGLDPLGLHRWSGNPGEEPSAPYEDPAARPSNGSCKTKYYSRYKDQRWNIGGKKEMPITTPLYEVVFQAYTICVYPNCVGNDDCCEGTARVVATVETTNSSLGALTQHIPGAGIFAPEIPAFYPSTKTHEIEKRLISVGDKFVSTGLVGSFDCNDDYNGKFYFTTGKDENETHKEPIYHTHHVTSINVKRLSCGVFDLDFKTSIVNPILTAPEGKHVMELTGPNDPNRPPQGFVGSQPPI